ncbi:MAG: YbaK/EbsC family protein [Candidatus Promineifilaceae bacterium]|nr:YbaK/EbsC family protein [Candidatus Promineifilaceae bacterium]
MHPANQKVSDAAQALGLSIEIVTFAETTRTAQEAADAIGCELDQIVKSLCFAVNGEPVMALVSGTNQLDERKLAILCGVGRKKVRRAPAEFVKDQTGFSIGGVPPFGHSQILPIYIDEDLLSFAEVWAAAGTPYSVFAIAPDRLEAASGGRVVVLKKG